MIDTTSIKIYALNTYGKCGMAGIGNLHSFRLDTIKDCLRALISAPASSPARRQAAQIALEELERPF